MHRVRLEPEERDRARSLSRSSDLSARARERLEMLLLSDGGWSPPRIGRHFDRHPDTVRRLVKDYQARSRAALHAESPGPEPDSERRAEVELALDKLLGEDRTWTSRQLAAALSGEGVQLSARQVRRYLQRLEAGYKRTVNTLEHKRDPEKVEHARRILERLKGGRRRAISS